MSKSNHLESLKDTMTVLSNQDKKQVKGGILLYCEEKRSTFLGMSYTSRRWRIANDGSLLLSVKM